MFGIGMGEFILILIVGLIIFGPKNLPEVGKALGKGLREFRKAQAALSATLEESVNETPKKSETKPAEVSLEKNSESVKISTDETFKVTKENPNAENKAAEISLEKKSEPARMTVDDVINTAKQNSITVAEDKISKEKTA